MLIGNWIFRGSVREGFIRYDYNSRDDLVRQWGGATYPVEYEFNAYGERSKMRSFRDTATDFDQASWPLGSYPSTTGDATTWDYDAPTGLLTGKTDANNKTVSYTYTANGKPATRTWARGVSATFSYDVATGEQLGIMYSDGTPGLQYAYNRLGQATQIQDALGWRTFIYCLCGKISTEQLPAGFFGANSSLAYKINSAANVPKGRTMGYALTRAGVVEQDVTYGFDAGTDRFASVATQTTVSSGARTFLYGYEPNSALLKSLAIQGNHPFTVNRSYEEKRDHLRSIDSRWSTGLRSRHEYAYDGRGQRTSVVQSGDAFADFGDATFQLFAYNGRGELTNAVSYLGSDPSVANPLPLHGRRHELSYDPIGNRVWSDRNGMPALRDNYTVNALNQYTIRENNTVPLSGTALTGTMVAVQGRSVPAGRQGAYWNDEVTVANTQGPWRGPLTVYTGKIGGGPDGVDLLRTDSRMAQIPAAAQGFVYDLDGNLTNDGVWEYFWDAENRLVAMQTATPAAAAGYPAQRLEFVYDHMNRRMEKRVLAGWNGIAFTSVAGHFRYLYVGWNLVAEYAVTSSSPLAMNLRRSYTWGLDIARSETAAGGVGALLQIADHASNRTYLVSYDGNGNVMALTDVVSGSLAAAYEYSPFGEPLRTQYRDPMIAGQPFRFSTKFTDDETGLVYYGRRYYSPSQGRFLGRDPKGESGGRNLYGFTANNPVNRWDYLGMNSPIVMAAFVIKEKRLEPREVPIDGTEGFEVVWDEVDDDDSSSDDEIDEKCGQLYEALASALSMEARYAAYFADDGQYSNLTPLFDGIGLAATSGAIDALGLIAALAAGHHEQKIAMNGRSGPFGATYYTNARPSTVTYIRHAGGVLAVGGSFMNGFSLGTALVQEDAEGALLTIGNVGVSITAASWGGPPGIALAVGQLGVNAFVNGASAHFARQNYKQQVRAAAQARLTQDAAQKRIDDVSEQMTRLGCE